MEEVVVTYLKTLKIPVSPSGCRKLIRSHPEYPSLLSISDTLQRLGIPHQTARLSIQKVKEVAFPYLLQPDKGGALRLARGESDLNRAASSVDEISEWVILQAETTDNIIDQRARKAYKQFQLTTGYQVVFLISVVGLLAVGWGQVFSWYYSLLLVTALAGAIIGYILFSKEVGVNYEAVEAFCGKSPKSNCDRILKSEDAQLPGGLTLSDVVAGYFTFQLMMLGLLVPFAEVSASWLLALSALSILALPAVLFSLYVQAVKIKVWCRLCLLVDGILVAQAALFAAMYSGGVLLWNSISIPVVVASGLLLFAAGSSLYLLKQYMEQAAASEQAELTAKRVKYRPEVFLQLLHQSKKVDDTLLRDELIIGNRQAPVTVLMVASLGCGPCREGFERGVELVKAYPDLVKLAVRFKPDTPTNGNGVKDHSDPETPWSATMQYWLLYIAGKDKESQLTESLISDWYSMMNLDEFLKRYEVNNNSSRNNIKELERVYALWFEENGEISKTPTFFINGYELPKNYRFEEVMILFPSLIVESKQFEDGNNRSYRQDAVL